MYGNGLTILSNYQQGQVPLNMHGVSPRAIKGSTLSSMVRRPKKLISVMFVFCIHYTQNETLPNTSKFIAGFPLFFNNCSKSKPTRKIQTFFLFYIISWKNIIIVKLGCCYLLKIDYNTIDHGISSHCGNWLNIVIVYYLFVSEAEWNINPDSRQKKIVKII